MNAKKEIVKKVVMSRRLLVISKLMEESKLNSEELHNMQKKYVQLLQHLDLVNTVNIAYTSERMCWKKERTQSFWETDCQRADDSFFKNNFRMSRSLFNKLCDLLPGMRKSDTRMRESIQLEKRVAIALYALGSSAEYRTIANMFGIGKSTVGVILLSFVDEVWKVLAPIYLKNFPMSREKMESLVEEFEALGFPQCMGAIDGCHIEIHPPHEDATDYYNYKGWYSIVLLALVDARCRFIYVSCGSPGRCNDSQIFSESSLKKELDSCSLMRDLKKNISGVDVPVLIIGDSAFRLSDALMKPYPFQLLQSYEQKSFNYALSKSRRVVENAFGHLKARFRRIGKGIDNAISNANAIVMSCCVLHNYLNENNDRINEKWLEALGVMEANRSYPEYTTLIGDSFTQDKNPEKIRSAISTSLFFEEVPQVPADNGEGVVMEGDLNGEGAGSGEGDTVQLLGDGDFGTVELLGDIVWDSDVEFIS